MNSGAVGSLSGLESSFILVGGTGEFSRSRGIGSTFSGCISTGGGSGSLGVLVGKGRSIEMVGLGNVVSSSLLEGWLIVVVSETLVAPFTTAVIFKFDGVGGGPM